MFSRSRWTGFALALALLALPVLQANAQTFVFSLHNEKTGRSATYTEANLDMTIRGSRSSIGFIANHNADKPTPPGGGLEDEFSAVFVAPVEEALRPALYADIDCHGDQRGRAAGMEVVVHNPQCSAGAENFGWFAVRQIRFDAQGTLTGLELAFSQRMGSPTAPALSGVIRYNIGPLSLSLETGANSKFGTLQQTHFGDTSLFRLDNLSGGTLRYTASVLRAQWLIDISAGKPLAVGRYATHSTSGQAPVTMSLMRGSPGTFPNRNVHCYGPGVLTVKSIKRDTAGRVVALRANFEQYCGNGPPQQDTASSSMVRGEIRFKH